MNKESEIVLQVRKFLENRGASGASVEELGRMIGVKGGPADVVDLLVTEIAKQVDGAVKRGRLWFMDLTAGNKKSPDDSETGRPFLHIRGETIALWLEKSLLSRGEHIKSARLAMVAQGFGTEIIIPFSTVSNTNPYKDKNPHPAEPIHRMNPSTLRNLRHHLTNAICLTIGTAPLRALTSAFILAGEPPPAPALHIDMKILLSALTGFDPGKIDLPKIASVVSPMEQIPQSPEGKATLLRDLFSDLGETLEARGIDNPEKLRALTKQALGEGFDYSDTGFNRDFLDNLPGIPGIYRMFDSRGNLIYVGKALRLRERVSSYFKGPALPGSRIGRIRELVHKIETETTGNEPAALLAENEAIKKEKPILNIQETIHLRRKAPLNSSTFREFPGNSTVIFLPGKTDDEIEILTVNPGKGFELLSKKRGSILTSEEFSRILRTIHRDERDNKRNERIEIIDRWLERNRYRYPGIPAADSSTDEKLTELINSYLTLGNPSADGSIIIR